MTTNKVVSDLSEAQLLDLIVPLLPTAPTEIVTNGDDAAVVAAADGQVVVSCDQFVEGWHFRRDWSSGYDIGWRCVIPNLSDIAAMGATPTSLVISLALPGDLPVTWVTDFACGIAAACATMSTGVVGGDLSGAPNIYVSVTALGDLSGQQPVLRSGASAGDLLAYAGVRGYSAAGLALLKRGYQEQDDDEVAAIVAGHRRPDPPLWAGRVAAETGATAMIDISDGLLRDAGRLAQASGVIIDIDSASLEPDLQALLPATASLGVRATAPARQLAREWVLAGGEDHGLLATFPAGSQVPAPFRVIGSVRQAASTKPGVLVDDMEPTQSLGWDHFRN